MWKKAAIVLTLCMFLCSTAALAASPKKGGTLVFGRGGDSVGLDPAYETDGNSFMVCDNVFEALVEYADESTALEPGLAESWKISDDGKTYTFVLRKGVKFHDGTKFDANAVVFSIGRMMKERNLKFIGKGWDGPPQERPEPRGRPKPPRKPNPRSLRGGVTFQITSPVFTSQATSADFVPGPKLRKHTPS